jgi:hypothetical protein
MRHPSPIFRWFRRTFTWYFSAKILAILVLAVSAANIVATSKNYQAEMSSAYNAANNILVGDKGFAKPAASTTATGSCPSAGNVTFSSSPGTANNAITAGDIVYDVQVNATGTTPTLRCFTVTLTLTVSGPPTTKTLTIASGASVTAGWTIDCKLDTGLTTLPAVPFSFTLTVT